MPRQTLTGGWGTGTPKEYEIGIARTTAHSGSASAFLRSRISEPEKFGNLMQTFQADNYRGERLRMTAYVKTETVTDSAGLWMRVDGLEKHSLSFDNMQNRPIVGTMDWTQYAVVLDVPQESAMIVFGVLLVGPGCVWVDDFNFEVVGLDVPTTDLRLSHPSHPQNLGFEE